MTPIRLRSLRSKLLLAFGVLALAPLVVLSVLSTRESTQKLEALAGEHLSARAVTVANAFDAYLDERQADVALFVRHPAAVTGTTQELTALADSYIEAASSYDLIVIADPDGKILATNTHTGDHKQVSGLVGKSVQGQAWFDATRAAPAGTHYMSPGAEISPLVAQSTHADGKGVTFAMGIFDEHGQLVRVWANQISWERSFTAIVRRELELMKRTGITTAQIDVMDRGGRLMDEAPVAGDLSTLNLLKTSTAAQASVNGPAGYVHEVDPIDHRDDMVGYAPVPHPNGWIVLTHETDAEVASSADGIRHFALLVGLCAGAFVVLGSIWFARGLTRRLAGVVHTLERVAEGDLTARAPTHGDDEIASMTRALHGALDRIGGAFGSIGQGVVAVSQASEALTTVGATLSASAQDTSRQAGIVATASEQAGKNVQTVAAGTEEMSVTIKEVAKNAAEAARVATAAVVRAERTNALVGKLGESSAEIGNVLKVITSIAEQTNLLALNATIEAARAGEAGKGFAVVANEVKELAKETARATDDITRKIAAIQTDTASAVAAIGEITLVIGQINDIQSTIASAVEQQAATTNEIGRNLHELAEASNEIAQNVTSVAASAGSTSDCSQQTRSAATGLADLSRSLDDQMRQFRFKRGEGPAPRRQTTGTLVRVPTIAFEGTTPPGLRH